jgi:hypothetical protein
LTRQGAEHVLFHRRKSNQGAADAGAEKIDRDHGDDDDDDLSRGLGVVDFDIEAGRTVVCNVSRTVVAAVRERYANVVTVLVTAPREVLGRRLASRERAGEFAEPATAGGYFFAPSRFGVSSPSLADALQAAARAPLSRRGAPDRSMGPILASWASHVCV